MASDYNGLFASRLDADGFAILEEARRINLEMGLVLAAYLYVGISTLIVEDRTLECALDASEAGCDDASLLVSPMVDAPVAIDRIREPMMEEEAIVYIEYSKVSINEYG